MDNELTEEQKHRVETINWLLKKIEPKINHYTECGDEVSEDRFRFMKWYLLNEFLDIAKKVESAK